MQHHACHFSRVTAWVGTCVLAVSAVACGDAPTAPSAETLSIAVAPTTLLVGETAQLRAVVQSPGRSDEDVTERAAWSSDSADVLTVSAVGVVRAVSAGSANIRASYDSLSAQARVTASFARVRVAGVVHESAPTTDRVIANAEVVAKRGDNEIARAVSDAQGRFELDAPETQLRLEVRADGFEMNSWEGQATGSSALRVALEPLLRIVTTKIRGVLAPCFYDGCSTDVPYPSQIFHEVPIHRSGRLELFVGVLDYDYNERIDVEVRGCAGEPRAFARGYFWHSLPQPPHVPKVLSIDVRGGCTYEVKISNYDGGKWGRGRYEGLVTHPH
jgi:hypothetical protein